MGKNGLITDEKYKAKVFNDNFTSIIQHLPIE